MKQILQSLKTGITEVAELPVPNNSPGSLLIKTSRTLLSAGTERMLLKFGKANLLEKAFQQPDKVKMIIDKINSDGLKPTIETIFNKLDKPLPLGYCNAGYVEEIGLEVTNFKKGDRVVSNGMHAEVISVPKNLCAKIPDSVSNDEACFTVIGAVALQGVRLLQPTLGETIVVTGLGLVGLMAVQLLRANGCRVLGLDYDKEKLLLAKKFGAEVVDLTSEDPLVLAKKFSRGRGVDATIITAATSSNEPVSQAAKMCRKRGRIVLVGVTGLELSREDFFKKELTFQVSASYGPGRYDPNYENKGQDYPIGFVRWTEQRNFEAVLDMMSEGLIDVKPLISHRFEIQNAIKAYEVVEGKEKSLGILLTYPGLEINESARNVLIKKDKIKINFKKNNQTKKVNLGFIGSGNYASSVLIPAFKSAGGELKIITSSSGISSTNIGKKFNFSETTTDNNRIFKDPIIDATVISTRHNNHADLVIKSLENNKHVFVEKPLCLTLDQLKIIKNIYNSSNILMIGFNRRFAPQIQKMKELLDDVKTPKAMIMTINAGFIPDDHWVQDLEIGGGRIIGETCHFIDLLRFLTGEAIVEYKLQVMDAMQKDTVSINLKFADGSVGTIHYFSNGSKSFPKERLEVFASGKVLQLDNYRKLKGFGWTNFKSMNLWSQDKGQKSCIQAFINSISRQEKSPISIEEIFEISKISIELSNLKNS